MSELKGINVSSTIVPYTTEDKFATHDSIYGKGGFKSVSSIEERDAIPEERLSEGTLVYVKEDNTNQFFYQYINGAWEESIINKKTSVSSDPEEFIENGQPGDITYIEGDNRFYEIVTNEETGEKELKELETYKIDDLGSVGTEKYNFILNDGTHDFFVAPNSVYMNGDRFCVGKINLGYTSLRTLSTEEAPTVLYAPAKTGIIATTEDTAAITTLIAQLQGQMSAVYVENSMATSTSTNSHAYDSMFNPDLTREDEGYYYESGYGRVFNINYGYLDPKTDPHQRHILFYVAGSYNDSEEVGTSCTKEDRVFSDIISISLAYEDFSGGNKVYHINSKLKGLFWWTDDRVNKRLSFYAPHHTYFTIKILTRTVFERIDRPTTYDPTLKYFDFEDYIVYTGDEKLEGFKEIEDYNNSEYYSKEIERVEEEIEKAPSVYNLDYYSSGLVRDNINVDDYNVFIVNSNNYLIGDEPGKFSLDVAISETIYQKSFKFVFIAPNDFNNFQLTYDGNVVLNLQDLNIKDGEGIYITPIAARIKEDDEMDYSWSYYIEESSLPNHDETISVVTYNNKPALSVPTVEYKMYKFDTGDQINYQVSGILSKPYLELLSDSSYALHIPVDTGLIFLHCTEDLFEYLGVNTISVSKIVPIENTDFRTYQEISLKIDLFGANDAGIVRQFKIKTVNGTQSQRVTNDSFFHLSDQDGTGWNDSNTVYSDNDMHYFRLKKVPYNESTEIGVWNLLFKDTKDTGTTDSAIPNSEITTLLTDLEMII